jgi:L-asparaginase II
MQPGDAAPLAVTTRSGLDESVHFGVAVAVAADGRVAVSVGNPDAVIYPRSSNKPGQAVAMVRHGLSLPDELLALVCASHDGTPMHTDGARRILGSVGLDESALCNTADFPLDAEAAAAAVRSGTARSSLMMNCSGKHAGMLATCRTNDWPTTGYLAPEHPLQQAITATLAELIGGPPAHIGIDGCGAPAHAMSLHQLARMFRSVSSENGEPAAAAIHRAMTSAPQMVGGERRDVTVLMRGVSGLIVKDGADGVMAAALPDGRSVALKVADGGDRARVPVMLDLLAAVGVDIDGLRPVLSRPILGHGLAVGAVRSLVGG